MWVWCCWNCSHSCSSRPQPLLSVSAALLSQIIHSSFFASPLSASAPVFSLRFPLAFWLYVEVVCAMAVSKVLRRGIRCGAFIKLCHVGVLRLINITWASMMCMYVPHTYTYVVPLSHWLCLALTTHTYSNSCPFVFTTYIIFICTYLTDLDEMQTHMQACTHDIYAIAYAVTDMAANFTSRCRRVLLALCSRWIRWGMKPNTPQYWSCGRNDFSWWSCI